MEVVNPFILKNKSRMIKYIDEVATGPTCDENQLEPDLIIKGQPDRELATIHSICEIHLPQIQQQAHNRVYCHMNCFFPFMLIYHFSFLPIFIKATLKKLATVIEMLTAHKQKYLDMLW